MSADLITENLISLIFDRAPIWNSQDHNHKNRKLVNRLWLDIKKELNIEVHELKKKWKNIKDQYRKELKKIPTPRSGDAGGVTYTSSWAHFDQMSFLRDEIVPNAADSNLNGTEASDLINNDNIETEDHFQENSQNDTTVGDTEASTQDSFTSLQYGSNSQRPRQRKTANDIRNEFLELEKKRIRLLENDLSNKNRNESSRDEQRSEDYHFLMSLLPQMERFTPIQRFRVRQKLNQVFLDELNVDNIDMHI